MPSTDRPTIRVTTIADLLALIPFLLGFQPQHSLVLVALNDDGVPFTARLTLPTPGQPPAPVRAAWDTITAKLASAGGARVVLVGYGPADQIQAAVDTATDALQGADIPITDMLRVADGRFWHLDRPDTDGTAFDATTNPAAATAVYAGLVALPDRDALAATLTPVTGPARVRMATATAAACAVLVDLLDAARPDTSGHGEPDDDPDAVLDTPLGLALQHAARTYLTQAQDSYRNRLPVDDDHAAILTVLLSLPSLRDYAARRTSAETWQQQMWTDLIRRAEPPFVAGPAVLLALCALRSGNGALAGIAVNRALDTDPDDRLAQLLTRAIAAGIDPDTVAALLAD